MAGSATDKLGLSFKVRLCIQSVFNVSSTQPQTAPLKSYTCGADRVRVSETCRWLEAVVSFFKESVVVVKRSCVLRVQDPAAQDPGDILCPC